MKNVRNETMGWRKECSQRGKINLNEMKEESKKKMRTKNKVRKRREKEGKMPKIMQKIFVR